MLKYALLGFLRYKLETGYELKQTMDKSTRSFLACRAKPNLYDS